MNIIETWFVIAVTVAVLALLSVIPTLLLRKRLPFPVGIVLLCIEVSLTVFAGNFALALGFFMR